MHPGIRRHSAESGFTLLELLLVMAVMAILGILVVPGFNRVIDNYRLQSEANTLAQYMRLTRTNAIMSGNTCYILFYENNRYQVGLRSDNWVTLADNISMIASFEYSVTNTTACGFKDSGVPVKGGHVMLINRRGQAKYVIVNPVMGRIRVSDTLGPSDE